jgi:hypothetical protein
MSFSIVRPNGDIIFDDIVLESRDSVFACRRKVEDKLRGEVAFVLSTGSLMTIDPPDSSNDCIISAFVLSEWQPMASSFGCFAAVQVDGSVVTWGDAHGPSEAVQSQLCDVQRIFSNEMAFAALKRDGSVVTWGSDFRGGDSEAVQAQLAGVHQVFSTSSAFAALKHSGSVVTWGSASGGDSRAVQAQLADVKHIFSNHCAFAALKHMGSVVTWGVPFFLWWRLNVGPSRAHGGCGAYCRHC